MLWLLLLQVWASCLWLGQGEVVTPFESCPRFFYQSIIPDDALTPQRPAWICQTLNNTPFYATLYDKQKRIPVYSAYIYEPLNITTKHTWTVEPQLIRSNLSENMETVWWLLNREHVPKQEIMDSQALSEDYYRSNWDRGHLNPNGHHNSVVSRNATFTLTNIVPMHQTLSRVTWRNYNQQTMRSETQNCQTTYVIVGAVPGNSYISQNRVNIPSYIWSGACCETNNNTTKAWAAIAENNQNQVRVITLGQLEAILAQLYGVQSLSLFHMDCPR